MSADLMYPRPTVAVELPTLGQNFRAREGGLYANTLRLKTPQIDITITASGRRTPANRPEYAHVSIELSAGLFQVLPQLTPAQARQTAAALLAAADAVDHWASSLVAESTDQQQVLA
jgi:hypothetical protein